jgi:hypothetical protein
MAFSDLPATDLQAIAERGLSSFLRAVARVVPGTDLEDAADCWLRAVESTEWDPKMSSDRFIVQITINALATLRTDQLTKKHLSLKDNLHPSRP